MCASGAVATGRSTGVCLPQGEDVLRFADRLVAAIDQAISRQVNRILHHARFQAMEAGWRGLALLMRTKGDAPDVKVKILNVSWAELARSLERAPEFDQSHLFDLVYSREFGMPGGEPFGMLIGDYALAGTAEEGARDPVGALTALAAVSAAAFAPFIAGAAPALLQLERFGDLARLPDLKATDDLARLRWKRLRQREDTRFLGLVAPRILLRQPYAAHDRRRRDGFAFCEEVMLDGSHLVWGNGAFAFASVVMRRYLASGWFADLRGVPQDEEGGGLVGDVAPFSLGLESHGRTDLPAVEVRLTKGQEQALSDAGLVPIATTYLSSALVFNSNQSLHQPAHYANAQARQNARLSAMLQYVLCAARFAHYLKVMLREEVGRISDAPGIEAKLNNWLARYTLGNDDADALLRARFPLRLASVEVREQAGRPGTFLCAVRLQPHFQLDDVATTFHLYAETASDAVSAVRASA
ncbi:type VI secretion system contractile sheath large subunit [Xanthobacteraceae bacterium A53D]